MDIKSFIKRRGFRNSIRESGTVADEVEAPAIQVMSETKEKREPSKATEPAPAPEQPTRNSSTPVRRLQRLSVPDGTGFGIVGITSRAPKTQDEQN